MKILDKNNPTQAAYTLREKSSPELDYKYFHVWINKETKEQFFVTADDISLHPEIYNLFTWTSYEADTCNYSPGTNGFYTARTGEYIYTVYQSNQPEYFDLTTAVAVETGLLRIESERVQYNSVSAGDNYHIPVLNTTNINVVNKNKCDE